MRRHHPNPRAEILVSPDIYGQLLSASTRTGFKKEDWEIAAEAIDEWTRRHNPDSLGMAATSGYQWKRLFLPDGTLLRTVFNGKNHHCLVEGDRIVYDGKSVSPSGFVNAVGGIRRNAWTSTWILFPETKEWKLADSLRTRDRRPRTCRPALPDQPPAPPPPETVPASAPQGRDASIAAEGRSPQDVGQSQQPPPTNVNGAACSWQPPLDTPPLPPMGNGCGRERRANRDDPMVTLLRQELLPVLYRICGVNPAHGASNMTDTSAS